MFLLFRHCYIGQFAKETKQNVVIATKNQTNTSHHSSFRPMLDEIKNYFRDIATSHTGIKSFNYGGIERIISRHVGTETEYPLLFMEKPSFAISGTVSNVVMVPTIAIVVLKNSDPNDLPKYEADESEAYHILSDIIAKMCDDTINGLIKWFDIGQSSIDPIDTITLDGDVGFRFQFKMQENISVCVNPSVWA